MVTGGVVITFADHQATRHSIQIINVATGSLATGLARVYLQIGKRANGIRQENVIAAGSTGS
ncbi:hypothetical protein ACVWYQ_003690 [Bradyrhizobium sp. USDA 3397]